MEQLKIEHLSAYLPYGLKMEFLNYPMGRHFRTLQLDCGHDFNVYLQNNWIRPLLRPLSDLTKEIEHNGERFVPIERLACLYDFELSDRYFIRMYIDGGYTTSLLELPYILVQKLLEWHFNVFNLPEDLYVDINTLTTHPKQ